MKILTIGLGVVLAIIVYGIVSNYMKEKSKLARHRNPANVRRRRNEPAELSTTGEISYIKVKESIEE